MHLVLGIVVVLIAGTIFAHGIAKARSAGAPSVAAARNPRGRTSGSGTPSARATAKTIWAQAKATNWLEQQRHHRTNGTSPPPGRARRMAGAVRDRARAKPPAPAGVTIHPPGPSPAPPPPPQTAPRPASTNGRKPTVTSNGNASTASAEKLIEGVNQVHAEAAAGGIHSKHGGIKSCTEGAIRFGAMAGMLSRAMSEPGSNYGPEITEPLAKAGTHLQAASMAFSEADAALTTLLHMTVGDLASSSRQAPNHTELSENGSH